MGTRILGDRNRKIKFIDFSGTMLILHDLRIPVPKQIDWNNFSYTLAIAL